MTRKIEGFRATLFLSHGKKMVMCHHEKEGKEDEIGRDAAGKFLGLSLNRGVHALAEV